MMHFQSIHWVFKITSENEKLFLSESLVPLKPTMSQWSRRDTWVQKSWVLCFSATLKKSLLLCMKHGGKSTVHLCSSALTCQRRPEASYTVSQPNTEKRATASASVRVPLAPSCRSPRSPGLVQVVSQRTQATHECFARKDLLRHCLGDQKSFIQAFQNSQKRKLRKADVTFSPSQ